MLRGSSKKTGWFKVCCFALLLVLGFAACDNVTLPGSEGELGPRTQLADAAAQRILDLLVSDVEFDFGQLDKTALTGLSLRFSCVVDTGESPSIAEIEAQVKKGCGEWGLEGDKGIAAGGGIAVFVILNGNGGAGPLLTDNVVDWAQNQTNLKSDSNTYAEGTTEWTLLQQIIAENCSGTSVDEKVRSVNLLLFNWLWYNVNGQRDAYAVLEGANSNGAWGTQCDGYARSMVALLRAWNVRARYISGHTSTYTGGPGGGAHAWVQVWNGSEWRMVDPTWNDPVLSQSQMDNPTFVQYVRATYPNQWMMLKTINGDRVKTEEAQQGFYTPPKLHNARL
jgi:hypothetical protein